MATICPGTTVGTRDTGVDQTDKARMTDQHCTIELPVMMGIHACAVCSLSLSSHMAAKHLKGGYRELGIEF